LKVDAETRFHELCSDIVEWGERIPVLIAGKTMDEFAADELTYLAVWKCVEVLGEASGRILQLDTSYGERYPQLHLRSAYAMRNRLTHGYTDVDTGILWVTCREFVPQMVEAARAILCDAEAR